MFRRFLVSFFLLLTLIPNQPLSAASETVYVNVGRAYLRKGPGVEYVNQTLIEKNTALTVLSKRGNWLKVNSSLGESGWINKRATTQTPPPEVLVASLKARITHLEGETSLKEERIRTLADTRQDVELTSSQRLLEVQQLQSQVTALESDRSFLWACLGVVVLLLGFGIGFFSGNSRRNAEASR